MPDEILEPGNGQQPGNGEQPATGEQPETGEQPTEEHDRMAQPVDAEEPPRLPFPVVGIGASAGGLEAVSEFLDAMPPDAGLAFVLVQHLPPDRARPLAEILGRRTSMPVRQVEDGMAVEQNHVYVIRPGHVLTIKDGALRLGPELGTSRAANRPVDDLFRSLAEEQRERAIAVVMSGMGSNGTAGAQAVKAVGGLCVAQDPESALFPSMPRHLIDAGYADYIAKPSEMPEILLSYSGSSYAKGGREADAKATLEKEQRHLREILAILRTRTRQDFTGYKKATVLRRVQRRMGLTRSADLADYARHLRQSPTEVTNLADDLLIHVTGFFRDPDAWQALHERVIVPLVAAREYGAPVRAWVTACSSGEEAYSLAMLLVEESDRLGKRLDIKVFATDLAERTLAHARAGVYPGGIESELPHERLHRFFSKEDEVYRIRQDLRDRVVFAPQNILQDPPFSRLDIASCRNLLIYLEPEIQNRVLALLHFGLREGGALFLGNSETVAGAEEFFEPVDKKARIFRRVGPTRHGAVEFPLPRSHLNSGGREESGATSAPMRSPREGDRPAVAELTRRTLLDHHTPPAVTIDRDQRIVYYHGDTRPFLQQQSGEPTRDILLLARDGVRGAVRNALHQAADRGGLATVHDGWAEMKPGQRVRVSVSVSPLIGENLAEGTPADLFVVSFKERGDLYGAPPVESQAEGEVKTDEIRRLRSELQSTIEELQTSNEELKASNEEVMSINEELQSSNEELETGKEEMQSLNEELRTVNAQLRAKMEEHLASSSDLASLLSSTNIAVLFLDPSFNIRRFTPAMRDLVDLISSDIGRPLAALAFRFEDRHLINDARSVLDRLVPIEREITAANGNHYIRRVLPYRTADNRIDGVVITFIDITDRRRAEEALRKSEERLRLSLKAARMGIWTLDFETRTQMRDGNLNRLLGLPAEDTTQSFVEFLGHIHEDDRASVERAFHQTANERRPLNIEFRIVQPDGTVRWLRDQGDVFGISPDRRYLAGACIDVTERRQAEAALRSSEERLRLIFACATDFAIFTLDADRRVTSWSPGAAAVFHYDEAEMLGRSADILFTPEDRAAKQPEIEIEQARKTGRAEDERWHLRKGEIRFYASGVTTLLGSGGGYVKVLRDLTDRKRLEDALRTARDELEVRVAERTAELISTQDRALRSERLAAIGQTVTTLAHEGRNALQRAMACLGMLGWKLEGKGEETDLAERIRKALTDLERLFEDLRDYAAPIKLDLAPTDIRSVWRDAWKKTVEHRTGRVGELIENFVAEDINCRADPFRLGQVFTNIFENAFDACPDQVRITVTADAIEHERKQAVRIKIQDNGPGFEPDARQRAVEPFYTTKPKGTGLGLAIVRRFVEAHGGTLVIEDSQPGATILITLPC